MEQAYYTRVQRFSPAGGAQLPVSHNHALNREATRGDIAQSAPGGTARVLVSASDTMEVFGHIHRIEWVSRAKRLRGEKQGLAGFSPGCACRRWASQLTRSWYSATDEMFWGGWCPGIVWPSKISSSPRGGNGPSRKRGYSTSGAAPPRSRLPGWHILAAHRWYILGEQGWHMLGAHCRYSLGENTRHNLGDQTWYILTRPMRAPASQERLRMCCLNSSVLSPSP